MCYVREFLGVMTHAECVESSERTEGWLPFPVTLRSEDSTHPTTKLGHSRCAAP